MAPNSLPPREIVRHWAELELPEQDPVAIEAQRAQIVARMELRLEQAVQQTAVSRRRVLVLGTLGGIAAALACAVGAWRWERARGVSAPEHALALATMQSVEGSVSVTHDGQTRAANSSAPGETALAPGDNLVTAPDGRTRVELADGVSLTLGAASRLHLPDSGALVASAGPHREQIRLDEGVVQIKVPHLSAGNSFGVKTPDAEVTVHGTAFTVEVGEFVAPDLPLRASDRSPGATLTTRVRVSEGVVSVMSAGREVFVRAGMQWMSPYAEPLHREATAPSGTPASEASPGPGNVPGGSSAKGLPSSSLADQNKLLQSASAAARGGDSRAAITHLNELLRRYPSSSLAPEARIQLFRALAASGDAAGAAREARRYLAAYPNGAARDEAQKMALDH